MTNEMLDLLRFKRLDSRNCDEAACHRLMATAATEIERFAKERDEYKVWWERDSTALGKALNEVSSLRASNEQLHAAVKTAQELAATRLMEIERLRGEAEVADEQLAQLRGFAEAHKNCRGSDEPSELRPPVKLEDYGPVIDEVAPVTKEAWDAMKLQGASRDASSDEYPQCTGEPRGCPYIYCHSQLKCAKAVK